MTEHSYIFDFRRVPSFFENFNESFSISDMNLSKTASPVLENFQLVLASYCPENIDECLDEDGLLNTDVVIAKDENDNDLIVTVGLDYLADEYGDATIELHDDATLDIGDINITFKAVFLTTLDGYVMGYSINPVNFTVTNKVVFDDDVVFWDIVRLNKDD